MKALAVGWFVILALIKNLSCNQIYFTAEKQPLTGKEGSCVEIQCNVSKSIKIHGAHWFWMKDAVWTQEKGYIGTVIYSRDKTVHPVSSDFADRVEYTGSPPSSWITYDSKSPKSCNILICNLTKTDNGSYALRYVGKDPNDKWMTDPSVSLTVTENPCPITFEKPSPVTESGTITLICSTSSSCSSNPEIVEVTQLPSASISNSQQTETKQRSTTVSLTVNWRDNGRTFSCKASDDKYMIKNISITVEYGPKDIQAEKSLENVVEKRPVTLTCSAKGHPDPTFTWFKDEENIGKTGAVLEIASIEESQSGKYHCEAKNKVNTTKSSTVNITVLYLPEVKVIPGAAVVQQGDTFNLTCHVERSKPQPHTYTWLLNGTVVKQENKYQYVVNSTEPENSGFYTCEATNIVHTGKSEPSHIKVEYGPRKTNISMGKEDKRVRVGESLTFTCKTDANPAPVTYSWYRYNKNKQIDPSQWKSNTTKDSSLFLDNVQRADEACYMCNATNRISTGRDSEPVCIQVLYAPTIPNLFMDTEVKEGQLITITCTVESFPPSKLTLNRTLSSNPQRPQLFATQPADDSHHNTFSHTFNVTSTDTGSYVCNATNSEGSKKSIDRKLVVNYCPKDVTVQAKPALVVHEKTPLRLICSTRSHPPATSFTWVKITDGKREVIAREHSFVLKSVSPSNRGLYSCTATNEIGTGVSPQAEVKVKYGPTEIKIIKAAEQQNDDGTTSVTLSCSSQSYPPITQYRWYKITTDKEHELVDRRQNYIVFSDQPGSYYCTATNEISQISSGPVHMFDRSLLKVLLICSILLILLVIVIVFVYRNRRRKSIQQRATNSPPCFGCLGFGNGARRRNRMNHPGTAEPFRSRDDLLPDQLRCQPHPDSTPASNINTVYCTVNLHTGKQGPSAPKPVRQQGGQTQDDSLNYASLHFGNKQKNKQARAVEDVYAMVSKQKPPKKIEQQLEDYENVNAVRTAKSPDPLNYDTDTSEDEVELNYSQVSFKAKPGHQRARRDSSSSDEDATQYSEVKI